MNRNIETFIGCYGAYADAQIALFGAPYDSTTSHRPGARFASKAMRYESSALETYSPYQNKDLEDTTVFDAGDLALPAGSPEPALNSVENFVKRLLQDNKLPLMIGGEHLLSLGMARALLKKYDNLHVIHFDAHADLRQEFMGQFLSHATVMRRIWELTGDGRIYQFGIRSGTKEEFAFASLHTCMRKFNFGGLKDVVVLLKDKPIYFSLDLDILDPSVLPGTGAPEAGGVSFEELLQAVYDMRGLNLVGMDINELNPMNDHSGVSTLVACKILREAILLFDR